MRSGWVIAMTIPAIALASTWREAKPMTAARDAPQEAQTRVDDRAQLAAGDGCHRAPRTALERAVDDVDEDERPDQDERGLDVVAVARAERLGRDDERRHAA